MFRSNANQIEFDALVRSISISKEDNKVYSTPEKIEDNHGSRFSISEFMKS